MANLTNIPFCSPIKFYHNTATPDIHLDDDFAFNQIKSFEFPYCYKQKWQFGDETKLQITSTIAPSPVKVYTGNGVLTSTAFAWSMVGSGGSLGLNLFECTVNLDALSAGFYHLYFECTLLSYSAKFVSEKIHAAAFHKNTLLFTYKNSHNALGAYFSTGVNFSFRCEAGLMDYQPSSEGKDYVDQIFNTTILSATPYDTFKLYIGEAPGVPNYVIKILNFIFAFDYVNIRQNRTQQGMQFVKPVGEKWEATRVKGFPQFGWATTIQPAINQSSLQYNDNAPVLTPGIIILYDLDANLFSTEPVEILHITDSKTI